MSITSEYAKYKTEYSKYVHKQLQNPNRRGSLTKQLTQQEYTEHHDRMKSAIGELITSSSGIGGQLARLLDLQSAIALSQVSKTLHSRSQSTWFLYKGKEIVLQYVRQGTRYQDYLSDGGWRDLFILVSEITGLAFTIYAASQAIKHANLIPEDAPKKTMSFDVDGVPCEMTMIDHPEARQSEFWSIAAGVVGTITITGTLIYNLSGVLNNVGLDTFFSTTENDLCGPQKTNFGLKVLSPDFPKWQLTKMKQNLMSNPKDWKQTPGLANEVCPLSGSLMLFPVVDRCGHYFDLRAVRARQLDLKTANPSACPISQEPDNRGWGIIKFDKRKFDDIQRIIKNKAD